MNKFPGFRVPSLKKNPAYRFAFSHLVITLKISKFELNGLYNFLSKVPDIFWVYLWIAWFRLNDHTLKWKSGVLRTYSGRWRFLECGGPVTAYQWTCPLRKISKFENFLREGFFIRLASPKLGDKKPHSPGGFPGDLQLL